jgi:putative peptidoglycan lipid II flippase
MRRIATLMGPATAGLAATQVNIFVNSIFASQQAGAASWLQYAFRLMQLPLGLFGVAVGTIATAALARRAAANDRAGMGETTRQALRLVAFLTIPASFGLAVLARPIIRLIYERGEFGATDTVATAAALLFYVIGLFAYSSVKVLAPAFYSLGRARVPLAASVSAVVANLVLNVALYPVLGYRGLALGTAVAAIVNFLVLAAAFQRGVGGLGERGLWLAVAKVTAASAGMALAAWGAWRGLEAWIGSGDLARNGLDALVPVAAGILAYGALCKLLRVQELDDMIAFLRRRRGA